MAKGGWIQISAPLGGRRWLATPFGVHKQLDTPFSGWGRLDSALGIPRPQGDLATPLGG